MALFGLGKKKTDAPGGPPTGVPTDRVIQLQQQGYSNDQIIQTLQQEGHNSSQIFDAMNQADIKGAVGGEDLPGAQPGGPAPAPMQEAAPAPTIPLPPEEMPPPMPAPAEMPMPAAADRTAIEEVAESIIDEKWEELMKSVDKIVEWKEATESKLVKIEQEIKDLKERFEVLHKGILSKVSEYDKGIKGVGSDIKAMEEVFKKTLPTFTANISELSRLTKKLKPSGRKK